MTTRKSGLLGALITILVLAGCGSSGGGQLSKADFIKKADAICTKYDAKGKALPTPQSLKDIETYVPKAKAIAQDEIKELRGLVSKAPDSVKDDYSKALDLIDQQLAKLDDLLAAAKANDTAKLQKILSDDSANKQADALAKKIGLTQCGSGG